MYPLLIFATGLVVGAAGTRLLKGANGPLKAKAAAATEKAQGGVEKAQEAVRDAALSGLSAIERTSARLRTKLTPEPADEAAGEPAAAPSVEAVAETAAPAAEAAPAEPEPPAPRPAGTEP